MSSRSVSENPVVGPRVSNFSPGKDGEAGDVGFIVDTAGRKKGHSKPDRILRQDPRVKTPPFSRNA
jgi:hypothetical protein